MPSINRLSTPPGKAGEPYVLPCYNGELWTIPTSNSTMRLLVTGKETDNAFAVVGTGGTYDKPIGFHYHREAHDVFLCVKGRINVWANDSARTLFPGDFASVPPNTIHQYQIDSNHTEFLGLIIPGGWEEFFRFIGEPFSGPLFPTHDKRNPFEVLIPKLMAATEKFDMVPVREKQQFDPQQWTGEENKLPGKCENGGYFLKSETGPKFLVGGMVVRPMATRKETADRFSIYSIEGSVIHHGKGLSQTLKFKDVHHAIYVLEGNMKLVIDSAEVIATAGETTFVPAGTPFNFNADTAFAKAYFFANGGGVGEILTSVGSSHDLAVVPEAADVQSWDAEKLSDLTSELGFEVL